MDQGAHLMSVSELDIWRAANELIKLHGEKAWDEAVMKYFDLRAVGDEEGMAVWRRIAQTIDRGSRPAN
jgi:hypothetical protein